MAHQRYGCWSAQVPPPLPVKRTSNGEGAQTNGNLEDKSLRDEIGKSGVGAPPQDHVKASAAGATAGVAPADGSPKIAAPTGALATFVHIPLSGENEHQGAAVKAAAPGNLPHPDHPVQPNSKMQDLTLAQEAVDNPSKWILYNQETGQQLDARAFVAAVAMLGNGPRRPPFDVDNLREQESNRQLPVAGSLRTGTRRSSNNSGHARRPSLLPQHGSGGSDSWFHSSGRSRSPRRVSNGKAYPSPALASSLPGLSSRKLNTASTNMALGEGVFSLGSARQCQVLHDIHAGGIRAMCFSPSGDYLATAGADHRVLVFKVLRRHESALGAPRLAAGGLLSLLGTTPEGGSLRSLNGMDTTSEWTLRLLDENPFRILVGHVGEVVALSWAADDSALLTGSADGTVRCWRPRKGDDCMAVFEHGGRVTSVSWDPGPTTAAGRGGVGRFLSGCMDGKLRLFSLDDEEPKAQVLADRPVTAVAFAPSGAAFVAGLVGGGVGFYRTEGMMQERAAECRRHGLRHSASHHIKPVRRLTLGSSGRSKGNDSARRRGSIGAAAGSNCITTEERVTGLCFRPQSESLSDGATGFATESWGNDVDVQSTGNVLPGVVDTAADDMPFAMSPGSMHEEHNSDENDASTGDDMYHQLRAPTSTIPRAGVGSISGGEKEDPSVWTGSRADILVSTNDSRIRVLETNRGGGVNVRLKLKGHNSDGVQGRLVAASYSEDGELMISGSTDGYVHMWPASRASTPMHSRRAVAWPNHREQHERLLVCPGKVAVPSAVFAPDSVVHSLGAGATRIIVAGDAHGSLRILVG